VFTTRAQQNTVRRIAWVRGNVFLSVLEAETKNERFIKMLSSKAWQTSQTSTMSLSVFKILSFDGYGDLQIV
jgi:hypothetical protein